MNQALQPPRYFSDSCAVGVDYAIDVINCQLQQLQFIGETLGRIHPQPSDGGFEPWIHKAGNEYYKAYPNDTLDSFSCVLPHNDEQFLSGGYFCQRTVSVIVWLNLDRQSGQPRTVELFKHQVVAALRDLSCVTSIERAVDQAFSGSNAVYPGFDLSGLETRFMTLPYGAFRVEMIVNYTNSQC